MIVNRVSFIVICSQKNWSRMNFSKSKVTIKRKQICVSMNFKMSMWIQMKQPSVNSSLHIGYFSPFGESILSTVRFRNAADIFNKKERFRIKQGQIHRRSWRALEADVLLLVKNWLLFNTIFNEYNTFDLSIERPFFQISGPNLDKCVLREYPAMIRTANF